MKIDPKKWAQRLKSKKRSPDELVDDQELPSKSSQVRAALFDKCPATNHADKISTLSTSTITPTMPSFQSTAEEIDARLRVLAIILDNTLMGPLYTTAALTRPELMARGDIMGILLGGIESSPNHIIPTEVWKQAGFILLLELYDQLKDDVKKVGSFEKQRDNFNNNPRKGEVLKQQKAAELNQKIEETRGEMFQTIKTFMEQHCMIGPTVNMTTYEKEMKEYIVDSIEPCVKLLCLNNINQTEVRAAIVRHLKNAPLESDKQLLAPINDLTEVNPKVFNSKLLDIEQSCLELGNAISGSVAQMIHGFKAVGKCLQDVTDASDYSMKAVLHQRAYEMMKYSMGKLEEVAEHVVGQQSVEDNFRAIPVETIQGAIDAVDALVDSSKQKDPNLRYATKLLKDSKQVWQLSKTAEPADYWTTQSDWRGKADYALECISNYSRKSKPIAEPTGIQLRALKSATEQNSFSNQAIVDSYNNVLTTISHNDAYLKILKDTVKSAKRTEGFSLERDGFTQDRKQNQIYKQVVTQLQYLQDTQRQLQALVDAVVIDKTGEKIQPFERAKYQLQELQRAAEIVMAPLKAQHEGEAVARCK